MHSTLTFRKRLVAWLIHKAVPSLNFLKKPKSFPFTLEEMRQMPLNTLGRETAIFLDKRNFDLLPNYEVHDAIHTILNYNTTTVGELKLQAFMWGNNSSSVEGRVLFLIGLIILPELWKELKLDYEGGKKAVTRISDWDMVALIKTDINALRSKLGLI